MKKFISGIIVGMILMCTIPTLAKTDTVQAIYNDIKIAVNGKNVTFAKGEEPVTINNRTYVSAKYVAEALDATVTWDSKSSTVNIKSEEVNETSTSTTSTAIDSQVNMNTSNVNTTENIIERTPDGLLVDYFDNKPYVKYIKINDKYSSSKSILKNKYKLDYDLITKKLNLLESNTGYSFSVLLDNVSFSEFENDVIFIEYNYYVNTILPLFN